MAFPKTFTRGDSTRYAHSASDVVRLQFDGFVEGAASAGERAETPNVPAPVSDDGEDGPSYAELQEQAKAHGIRANQSYDALFEALTSDDQPSLPGVPNPEYALDTAAVETEDDDA